MDKAVANFKAGDKIRCVSNHVTQAPEAAVGRRGVILSFDPEEGLYEVRLDVGRNKDMYSKWDLHQEEIINYQRRKHEEDNF